MAVEQMTESSGLLYSSPLLLPIIGVFVSLCVIHYWMQNRRTGKLGNKIPGPPTLPFIGKYQLLRKKNQNKTEKIVYIKHRLYYTNTFLLFIKLRKCSLLP